MPVAKPPVVVEPMSDADADAVLAIYAEGIATGTATFETAVPDWRRWMATHRKEPRLVARDVEGQVIGWTALSSWSGREVYAGVWTLIAGVQAENAASLALHESVGFRRVGVHERIGRDAARIWRDVVILERRTAAAGR